jgi:hypothetical protein
MEKDHICPLPVHDKVPSKNVGSDSHALEFVNMVVAPGLNCDHLQVEPLGLYRGLAVLVLVVCQKRNVAKDQQSNL